MCGVRKKKKNQKLETWTLNFKYFRRFSSLQLITWKSSWHHWHCNTGPMDPCHPRYMGSKSHKSSGDACQSKDFANKQTQSNVTKSRTSSSLNTNHTTQQRKLTSAQTLLFKVESHEFKPFKDAAEDYANKWQHRVENRILTIALFRHLQRRPNNSIGCLEETKLRGKGETKATDVLQVSTVTLT